MVISNETRNREAQLSILPIPQQWLLGRLDSLTQLAGTEIFALEQLYKFLSSFLFYRHKSTLTICKVAVSIVPQVVEHLSLHSSPFYF